MNPRPPVNILQTNPAANYQAHRAEIDAAIARVLASGWFILGRETAAFEQEFAAFLGVRHVVGVASGTDALVLALKAAGAGPGHGVVTVAHTAVATVAAIELAGATPVFADIDPDFYVLSSESLEAAILEYNSRPADERVELKAVIVVHLYGQPADMPAIQQVAGRHGLVVIEDCAQSHGATLLGRMTGTSGRAAAFSFYPTKNLGALGDGGAVATNDSATADQLRLLREYGWQQRYISQVQGMNSRLDEMQSAILRAKLPFLTAENARRREIAGWYQELLAGAAVRLPATRKDAIPVYHQYVVRHPDRDALRRHLSAQGVGTLVHYPVPAHLQPAYTGRCWTPREGLPHTEAAAGEILSLPMHPQLSRDEVAMVAARLTEWPNRSC